MFTSTITGAVPNVPAVRRLSSKNPSSVTESQSLKPPRASHPASTPCDRSRYMDSVSTRISGRFCPMLGRRCERR